MDTTKLTKLGLTQGEIKVYMALIKHGTQSKGPLANKANVSSSKIYEIAQKLIKKGLANTSLKNNITYYTATNPTFLKQYIEKKEKEFQTQKKIIDDILPKLHLLQNQSEQKTSFELYEGWKGIQNATWQALKETPEHSTTYGLGVQFSRRSSRYNYHKERVKKKIKLKDIFVKKPIQYKIEKHSANYKNRETRFIPSFFKIGMGIFPDRVHIYLPDELPSLLVIKHPRIIQAFQKFHNNLWKQAKKKEPFLPKNNSLSKKTKKI